MRTPQTPKVPCFPPEYSKPNGDSGCSTLEKGNLFITDVLRDLLRPEKSADQGRAGKAGKAKSRN